MRVVETPFLSSNPGRVLLLAAAVFLLSTAAYVITGSIYPVAGGMPIGITLSFVAVGLGMNTHAEATFYAITTLPPVLWGFYYLQAHMPGTASFGYVVGLIGLVALGKAALGAGAEATV